MHRPRPVAEPSARLLCFPHGGRGATMYRSWAPLLPPGVELCAVTLPGREARFDEPVPTDFDALVGQLGSALLPILRDVPVTFFGHSLGALLAFELSRRLRADGLAQPAHLVVSGCRPPHLPEHAAIADLPDDRFVAHLRGLNGTADGILDNPQALELLLPVLRADFRLAEGYLCRRTGALRCPITVLAGSADPETQTVDLTRWGEQTDGGFELRRFPGDHFFLDSARPLVVAAATQTLLPWLVG